MTSAAPDLVENKLAETVIGQFLLTARKKGAATAARYRVGDSWQTLTWSALAERAAAWSDGLLALGVQPGDRVAIIGPTRVEWAVADIATMAARAVTATIYHSNTPAECQYVAHDSGAVVVCVGDQEQLAKFRAIRAQLPKVRKVVLLEGEENDDWVISAAALEKLGKEKKPAQGFDARIAAVGKDDLNCLIYTSGTTGNPKGVMLSHGNWGYIAATLQMQDVMRPDDSVLGFLPLAHSFARAGTCAWFAGGFEMIFVDDLNRIVEAAQATRPSIMPAVPRVFEKAYNTVVSRGMAERGVAGTVFRWAMEQFDAYAAAREAGRPAPLTFALARVIFKKRVAPKLHERFGGRLRLFVSGGAPLSRRVAYFFELLGFEILEGYGLTETSAPSNINRPGRPRLGTVGPALPGTEIKIAPDGEILIRGPGVMKGYWNKPEATREVLDPDGWFHSGDIGHLDGDGNLVITDRKKDIIVTAGGKNVAPQNIENALKTEPIVSQVMVHGDRRKFLSALITVSEETARKIADEKGLAAKDYAELSQLPEVRAEVQAAVDRLNGALATYEQLKKFEILPQDFSQQTGELTPTLKVKRKFCSQKYKDILDKFYEGDAFD